tara:strand:- start:330 stop:587 length:258 start_codon:yes stop_codon:yes gene_type:complete
MSQLKDSKKSDHKTINEEPEGGGFNPADLEVALSENDIKTLERKQFIVKNSDIAIFDAMPLDNAQKADFLRFLSSGEKKTKVKTK